MKNDVTKEFKEKSNVFQETDLVRLFFAYIFVNPSSTPPDDETKSKHHEKKII
jgi:hypothetical protein